MWFLFFFFYVFNGLILISLIFWVSKNVCKLFHGWWFRGGAIQFFGTKRHHDKWLSTTENYLIKGCFAMTELGHGSNVCIIASYYLVDNFQTSNENRYPEGLRYLDSLFSGSRH